MSAEMRISSISSQVCSSSLPDDSRLSSADPNADWDLASLPRSRTIRPADGGGFSTSGAAGGGVRRSGGGAWTPAGAASGGACVAGGAAVAVPP